MRVRRSAWTCGTIALVVLVVTLAPPPALTPANASATTPGLVVSTTPLASEGTLSTGGAPLTVAPAFVPAPGDSVVGPLSATLPLSAVVGLAPSDPVGLSEYVAGEYLPGSPNYHAYLSPQEVATEYGPSARSIAAARSYFEGFGLSVTSPANGFLLQVTGPSASVGRAFGTTFWQYVDPAGRLFVSHPTPAVLPAGYAWTGAYGLGNTTPMHPAYSLASSPTPVAGPALTCPPPSFGLTPCDIEQAYSIAPLYVNGTTGAGVTVGIVDSYDAAEPETALESDFLTFARNFGLPAGTVSYAYPVPTTANLNRTGANIAWGVEEALDMQWIRATAPGASIRMTFSPDSGPGLLYAIDWLVATDSVNVISLSWGEPFTGIYNQFAGPCSFACNASSDGSYTLLNPVVEAAAAEGISVFSATGDCGAADGTAGLAVHYPASDPYVTAVGGTVLRVTSTGAYLTESGWNGSDPGTIRPGCANQGGSGGGYSPLPRPAWQLGVNPPFAGRAVPDVSLDAGNPALIVYGSATTAVGGTSLSTPIWAGIAAVADQYAHTPLGFLNPSLYQVYESANYSRDFHDIITGNNGYPAGQRWDPVTGIGTPNVSSLVRDLTRSASGRLNGPPVDLFASPRYGRAPLTVSFVLNGSSAALVHGVNFGDGNSSLGGSDYRHTYTQPGVYSAVGFAADYGANSSVSPPIAIVVGGGVALSVSLSASAVAVPADGAVNFSVSSTGGRGPYLYNFSFGDGTYLSNQTGPIVTHVYHAAGAFCAAAVARDSAVPIDGAESARVGIAVGGVSPPNCGGAVAPLVVIPNASLQLRDAPAEFPTLFESSGGVPPPPGISNSMQYLASDPYVRACQCAIFHSPGNYSVRVWENDTVGNGATATTNVTVTPALVATLTASTLSGTAPLTVDFTASVSGGYRSSASVTRWTFGEGSGAVGATASFTYTVPGEYLAEASVSDQGHGNASEAFLIDVRAPGTTTGYGLAATIAPAVDIESGTTVHFMGTILAPNGSGPLTLRWDLGEGFGAYGLQTNQTYYAPLPPSFANSLPIAVSLLAADGTSRYTTNLVLPSFFAVEPGGFVPRKSTLVLTTGIVPPIAPVPAEPYAYAAIEGADVYAVGWNFGDGSSATGLAVNHTYSRVGVYTVVASAVDAFGDLAVVSTLFTANPVLGILGGPSTLAGEAPLSVHFAANASGGFGGPYGYVWRFTSGAPAIGPTAVRTFSKPGIYTATLNVTDRAGGYLVVSWTISVHQELISPATVILLGAVAGGVAGLLAYWLPRREQRGGPDEFIP